jgi:hypothetical protein
VVGKRRAVEPHALVVVLARVRDGRHIPQRAVQVQRDRRAPQHTLQRRLHHAGELRRDLHHRVRVNRRVRREDDKRCDWLALRVVQPCDGHRAIQQSPAAPIAVQVRQLGGGEGNRRGAHALARLPYRLRDALRRERKKLWQKCAHSWQREAHPLVQPVRIGRAVRVARAQKQLRGLQSRRLQHGAREAVRNQQVIQRDHHRRLPAHLHRERAGVDRVVDACGRHVQPRVVAAQLDAYLGQVGRDVHLRRACS